MRGYKGGHRQLMQELAKVLRDAKEAAAIAVEEALHRQKEGMDNVQRQRKECLELVRNPNVSGPS